MDRCFEHPKNVYLVDFMCQYCTCTTQYHVHRLSWKTTYDTVHSKALQSGLLDVQSPKVNQVTLKARYAQLHVSWRNECESALIKETRKKQHFMCAITYLGNLNSLKRSKIAHEQYECGENRSKHRCDAQSCRTGGLATNRMEATHKYTHVRQSENQT